MRRTRSPEERQFYEIEALRGGWSVRQLDRQISSQFYTRILRSKNKRAVLQKGAFGGCINRHSAESTMLGLHPRLRANRIFFLILQMQKYAGHIKKLLNPPRQCQHRPNEASQPFFSPFSNINSASPRMKSVEANGVRVIGCVLPLLINVVAVSAVIKLKMLERSYREVLGDL